MIRNFIFDLGGVLIDLDVNKSIEAFMQLLDVSDGKTPVTGMDLMGGGETKCAQLYQTGDISTDEFVAAVQRLCKPNTTREQILGAWYAMLIGMPAHRLDVLRQIKQSGAHVYILSNINESHVVWTLNHLSSCGVKASKRCVAATSGAPCEVVNFENEDISSNSGISNPSSCNYADWVDVDMVFFSNEMRLAKPDPRIYAEVLRITDINPAETLYIDDLEQNILAGKEAGFNCLQALGDEWIAPVLKAIHP